MGFERVDAKSNQQWVRTEDRLRESERLPEDMTASAESRAEEVVKSMQLSAAIAGERLHETIPFEPQVENQLSLARAALRNAPHIKKLIPDIYEGQENEQAAFLVAAARKMAEAKAASN